jgi:hypothetical protein
MGSSAVPLPPTTTIPKKLPTLMDSPMHPIDNNDAIEFIVATFHEQLSAEDSSREPFDKANFAAQLIMVLNTPTSILSDCSICYESTTCIARLERLQISGVLVPSS